MAVTNKQLDRDLRSISRRVGKIEANIIGKEDFDKFRVMVVTRLQEFHDFMIVAQDRTVRNPAGQLNWQKLLEKLFAFLTPIALALLAAIQLLGDK